MTTFIPGWQTTVTLNSEDLTVIGSVVRLNMTRNVLSKPVFGSQFTASLSGQASAEFSANGHLASEKAAALQGIFESDDPVAFSLQVGTATEDTDAGLYSGLCSIRSYTLEASADGEWDWSIEASSTGTVTYTPAAGPPPPP